ncbi:doublecortin domain-containing protein 1-like [Sardina pilchardus]|uniref:doublecortin domain-containing protein 1-like n=1 Tax=Sardina pilchardus TaxID=27697 RepID=UPI002E0FAF4B
MNEDTSVKKDKSRLGGHRQQFEWAEGQLVSCRSPWLAVGVRAGEGSSADPTGSPLHLLPRNPSDPHQKHKPHSPAAAAANQRWRWLPEQRVLCAFYTDVQEQELTAACLASVCTSCVYPQPLLQQGYCWSSPGVEERVEVCVSCATELRGKGHLKRLPANSTFRCATANGNPRLNPKGSFRSLSVCETDLSTEAADATLQRLEENLGRLKTECPGQATKMWSPGAGRTGSTQLPVRILAHRNGLSQKEAQLVTAATMPLLLTEGTRRLGLPRAAQHLYTADGTRVLTMQQLKAWALNQSLQEHQPLTDTDTRPHTHMAAATLSGEAALEGGVDPTEAQALPLVTEAEVDTVDQALLALVLREPIPVWMSCGEPFQPPDVMKQKERQKLACWMKKGKLFVELDIRRHKMRQQKARPPQHQSPSRQIAQTVERAPEATADLDASETHIRVEESMQEQGSEPVQEGPPSSTHDLYYQPKVKRVLVHSNGGDISESIYVWGRTIDELLSCSTERLGLARPASLLYTMLGEPVTSLAHIQRDALLCVAAGEPFLTPKDCRDRIEMKANFARAMRQHRLTTSGTAVSLKELQTISVEDHNR